MSDITELLILWGLPELIEKFVEEDISPDILDSVLESDILAALAPQIGKRLVLKKKIEEYLGKLNCTFPSITDYGHFISRQPLTLSTVGQPSNASESSPTSSVTFLSSSPTPIVVPPINTVSTETIPQIQDVIYTIQKQSVEEPSSKKCKVILNKVQEFDLKACLHSNLLGKGLLNWYEIKGGFDSPRQGFLVEIIISYFINNEFTQLTNEDFVLLAKKIKYLFPTEITETYYLPPIKKRDSRDGKSGVSKGKLVDKYRNKLTFLRESGILPTRGQALRQDLDESFIEREQNLDSNSNQSQLWLKNNTQGDFNDIVHHWTLTFKERRQKIIYGAEEFTLNKIYEEYPVRNEQFGLNLINKDFEKIYPNVSTVIYQRWETVTRKLIEIRRSYVSTDYDKLLLNLLDTAKISEDYLHYLLLVLLPSLLPCKARITCKGKKPWKPKIVESREGLILWVDLPGDIETVKEKKKEKAIVLGLPVQPYIIVEGSGTQIHHVYVVVNDQLYSVETVLKAIDTCFQCYHVFNLKYQGESEHIWAFIQKAIYELSTKWDSPIPSIYYIINKIKL